ncbi:MAG: hypothetical protein IJT83_13435 [Victivallales bacterium]|nr:hypothetical protein [Victivallales bacterium]
MKTILHISLLLCLFLLAGCLTLEQSIQFKENGTLVASYTASYPVEQEQAIQAVMETALARKGLPPASFTDKTSTAAFYAQHGAELTLHRKSVHNGVATIQMMVIAKQASRAIAQGAFGEMRLKPVDEKVRLEIPLPQISPELKERAQKLCQGFTTSLTIETPGKLISHNGKQLASDKVTWTLSLENMPSGELFAEWSE